jgi:hypothetical protein
VARVASQLQGRALFGFPSRNGVRGSAERACVRGDPLELPPLRTAAQTPALTWPGLFYFFFLRCLLPCLAAAAL